MSNRVGLFSTLRQALHQSVDVTIWSNLSILIETPNINWYHVLYIDIWYMIPGLCFIHNFFVKTSWARWPEASLTSRTGEGSSGGRRAPGKWTCFFSLKVQDLLMWQMFQKKFHIVWKLDMFFSMMLYMYIYTYVTVIYLYISRISRLNLRMLVLLFLWDFRFGGDEISNVDRVVTGSRWFLSGLPEQVIHSIEKSYHLIGWWAIGDFRIPKFGYIFPRNLQQDLMNGPLHLSI